MGAYRLNVKAVRCPCCKGTGVAKILPIGCMWCRSAGRLSPEKAERYADQLIGIARGGYIAGDHDLKDCREMEAEASRVMSFLTTIHLAAHEATASTPSRAEGA